MRLGDEQAGVSISPTSLGLDSGHIGRSHLYYRPGIPGMVAGFRGKDAPFSNPPPKEAAAPGGMMGQFGKAFLEQASAPFRALHPTGKYLKEGWQSLSNLHPNQVQALREQLVGKAGKGMAADFHQGKGVMDQLRRGGWLSNTAKYTGPDKWKKAKNVAWRMMPGQKTMFVAPAAMEAVGTLRQDVDPETGRKIGLGERVGGAAMGMGTGLVSSGLFARAGTPMGFGGSMGNMLGGMVGSSAGSAIGSRLGRGVGRAASRATRPAHGLARALPALRCPVAGGERPIAAVRPIFARRQ